MKDIFRMSEHHLDLSVIVAAYNESSIIAKNIGQIITELNKRPEINWELICVDDGSQDNTGDLLDECAKTNPRVKTIHHRRNFGQGRALRSAFDICLGQIIITLDADLSYKIDNIFRLYDTLISSKSDIVLASAYMKGGSVSNVPFYRHMLSRFGNIYLGRITGHPISTTTCVVRAYQREVIDSLILTSDGMDLQIEILVKAATMGFRIHEIPASLEWSDQKAQKSGEKRVSKMRIFNTIYTYTLLGWLHRPASVFIFLSWLLIIPGLYMAVTIIIVSIERLKVNMYLGLADALELTLRQIVSIHYQNITFSAIFLGFGLLTFAFSLILVQNKSYQDELSRMIQMANRNRTRE